MNILFYLTPKQDLEYVYDDFTVRQIMEKMSRHRYSVVAVLKENGEYLTTISDGDILRLIHACDFDKEKAESIKFKDIPLHRPYKSLKIDATVGDLLKAATEQNFIPITDDRNMFIGIVRRKAIIEDFIKHCDNVNLKKVSQTLLNNNIN